MSDKKHIEEQRVAKLEKYTKLGNPFPHTFPITSQLNEIREKYDQILTSQAQTNDVYTIAGRISLKRDMGKVIFLTIRDEDSYLQLFIRQADVASEVFEKVQLFDIGDIIGVHGFIFKTKLGELSLYVQKADLLSKCLVELGDKYHGIKDKEIKYRNRSLDMVMNPESRSILKKRFQIIQKVREFMIKENFLEIETPMAQISYGGAEARPFTTHHNALDIDLYLRVAPEQNLKRVMVGGMEAIFEVNKNFRNEGIDATHNPEFTMLEAYKSYVDYNYMMDLLERMVRYVVQEMFGTTIIEYKGINIDFSKPWRKMTVEEAIKEGTGWDIDNMSDEMLLEKVKSHHLSVKGEERGYLLLALFEEFGEPLGIEPTHFIDYPKESTPFCKQHRKNSHLIERFESFIAGVELANAYSELNDAQLQRKLLEEQANRKLDDAKETWGDIDEEFLAAMDIGLPPAGGIGIGIDRLVMLLLDQHSIRDIIYFPTMKPHENK